MRTPLSWPPSGRPTLRGRSLALAGLLALCGCASARTTQARAAPKSQKECAACARMCEVAGDADKTGDVATCQEGCARDCP